MKIPDENLGRYSVLGVGLCALSLEQATRLVVARARQRPAGYVCVTGVHGVIESRADPGLRRIHNEAFLVTPDGMPMVWLGRLNGWSHVSRVYGPDLMLAVCDQGRAQGLRHFFYGGAAGVAADLRDSLVARFPGIQVSGTFTPPFRPLDEAESRSLRSQVAESQPDIIWVGLSTPSQERFMAGNAAHLATGLLVGVGAAFDFHSGRKRQAPRWLQRTGFEWLFRLVQEPRRLWRRYLVNNTVFAACIALQLTGIRKYPLVVQNDAG